MKRNNTLKLVIVLATLIVAGVLLFTMPMQLGLDLQGGVHVVMQAQPHGRYAHHTGHHGAGLHRHRAARQCAGYL